MYLFLYFYRYKIMIAFLRGQYALKSPASVVVDVNGVGYDVQISLNTYSAIADKADGMLFTYLHITENAQTLYGFWNLEEKEMFLNLVSVSGVGASTARMMLSGMIPDQIQKAIVMGDVNILCSIKGIGKKSAERLIVELKDKLAKQQNNWSSVGVKVEMVDMDAINALVALGIGRSVAEQAVKKVIQNSPNIALQDIIKQALKNI